MIYAGCDIGSLTTKAVILDDNRILCSSIIRSSRHPEESASEVLGQAMAQIGLDMNGIDKCIGTGYGRNRLSLASETVSEISCHAKAAYFLMPSVRTVIDIGGQDCKVVKLDNNGNVTKFHTNDKCASGTGRFLEVMANILSVSLDELGEMSNRAKAPLLMASSCTVWAQAEVIQAINDGVPLEDIGAGINRAMAARNAVLVNNIGFEKDVCMTGGVAKNAGVVKALEALLGQKIKRIAKVDPQLAGAFGAALMAREKQGKSNTVVKEMHPQCAAD